MKTKLLILFALFANLSFGQNPLPSIPVLQNFGEPFVRSNVKDLHIVQPLNTFDECEKLAVLVDIGDKAEHGNFGILFASLDGTSCTEVQVKNLAETQVVTQDFGEPTAWVVGIDGKVYIGTDGDGGHIIRVDVQRRVAVDLGRVLGFTSNPKGRVKTLTVGADLSICGTVDFVESNGNLTRVIAFKYKFGCGFQLIGGSRLAYNDILSTIRTYFPTMDSTISVGTDRKYTYVVMLNPTGQTVLVAVDNNTSYVNFVYVPNANGGYLVPGEMRLYNYAEDRVLVNYGGMHEIILSSSGGFQAQPTTLNPLSRIAGSIWDWGLNATPFQTAIPSNWGTTSYNNDSYLFSYTDFQGNSGEISIESCVRKVKKPITAIAPYVDESSAEKRIFMHGLIAQKAASFGQSSHIQQLGASILQAQAAVTNKMDYTQVYLGGHAIKNTLDDNLVLKYSSGSNWQINNNPADLFSVVRPANDPNPYNPMRWFIYMKMFKSKNIIACAGTNGGARPGAVGDETALGIIDVDNNYVNLVYDPLFSTYTNWGSSPMNIDNKNELIVIAGTKDVYQNSSDPSHIMIFNLDGQLVLDYDVRDNNGIALTPILNVVIDNAENLYFTTPYNLYVIPGYLKQKSGTATAELMFSSSTSRTQTIALFPQMNYLAFAVLDFADYKVKVMAIDVNDRNLSFQNPGNTWFIAGNIPATNGGMCREFAFMDNYCYIGGFTGLWGFDYSSITQPINDFDNYEVERISHKNSASLQKQAQIETVDKGIKIFPNPAKSTITVVIGSNAQQASNIEVYDTKGSLVVSKKVNLIKGANSVVVDIDRLVSGTYLVKVNNGLTVETKRFVKQ